MSVFSKNFGQKCQRTQWRGCMSLFLFRRIACQLHLALTSLVDTLSSLTIFKAIILIRIFAGAHFRTSFLYRCLSLLSPLSFVLGFQLGAPFQLPIWLTTHSSDSWQGLLFHFCCLMLLLFFSSLRACLAIA